MTSGLSQNVADTVRAELARRKVSQRALAEALGTSEAVVYRRLRGDTPLDVDELGAIARFLEMDVRDLLPAKSAVATQ